MKMSTLVAACAVIIIAMSSCERNFTCICVYPDSNISTTKTTVKGRKSDADMHCISLNKGAQKYGGACALE